MSNSNFFWLSSTHYVTDLSECMDRQERTAPGTTSFVAKAAVASWTVA